MGQILPRCWRYCSIPEYGLAYGVQEVFSLQYNSMGFSLPKLEDFTILNILFCVLARGLKETAVIIFVASIKSDLHLLYCSKKANTFYSQSAVGNN